MLGAALDTPDARPFVLALHGAVVNAATWLPLQRELGEGMEVVAPDLPGHGTRSDGTFTLKAALDLIEESLKDVHGTRPIVIVGDSLGGYLALIAGARFGERVQAVVAGSASFDMRGFGGVLVRATEVPGDIIHFFGGSKPLEQSLAFAIKRMTDAATAEAILSRGLRAQARNESIEVLRKIDLPQTVKACTGRVYIVNGSLDIPAVWFTRALAGKARDGYAVEIPYAPHGCAFVRPKEFADVIRTAIAGARVDVARKAQA